MCGIFGYANYNVPTSQIKILSTLVQGLRRLEYRGYDSAGLVVDGICPTDVVVIKAVGTVNKLQESVDKVIRDRFMSPLALPSHVGLAHTRWATHGAPSTLNSHPQVSDPEGTFVVVHNGIITNYKPLKEMLTSKGFEFESDTDTEVIAKLLKYIHNSVKEDDDQLSFPRLVMHLMHAIEGAYALLLRSTAFPNEIIACKVGSPLVLGLKPAVNDEIAVMKGSLKGEGPLSPKRTVPSHPNIHIEEGSTKAEYFFSSDASALVEHTDKVVYFEDNDIAHINEDGELQMFNFGNSDNAIALNRSIATLDMELEHIMKGSYPHFMLKEIYEQPESLLQSMRGRVLQTDTIKDASGRFYADVHLGGLSQRLGDFRRSSRIIFVACGTSYNSCVAARQVMEELTELPVSIELSSDFLDRETPLFRSDVCVFVSQSGETADTLAALRYAKKRQALTVGVVNVVGSSIARLTDCGVHLNAGAEVGVASTKAYTSQIIVIVIIALQLSIDSRIKQDRRKQIHEAMVKLPMLVRDTLDKLDKQMRAIADRLKQNGSILLFGRGYHFATCLEGALKIKELSYIHTEGIHAGELKHGPLALVDESMPIFLFAGKDSCSPKVQNALHQVTARGGFSNMIIIGTEGDAEIQKFSDKAELVLVPETVDCLQPVLGIIPMQLLSYHLAVARGLNVDQPRYVLLHILFLGALYAWTHLITDYF